MPYLFNPFHGKIGRGRWWLLQFLIFLTGLVAMIFTIKFLGDPSAPAGTRTRAESLALGIIFLAVIYMNFSVCLNRLRDSERSGLWYLAFMLPYAGTGLMVYLCGTQPGTCQGSQPRRPDPLTKRVAAMSRARSPTGRTGRAAGQAGFGRRTA
ncbi:MAG: DUF805 domain-containing protein [Pseudomonadota bacterium]